MIDSLKSMAVFSIVVDEKSFRKAADRLNLSPSVISHHVSSLESQLGAALIYRSTRSFSLTAQGKKLYEKTQIMLTAASDGINEFTGDSATHLVQLRIAMPEMLSFHPVFQSVTAFAHRHQGVQLALSLSDTRKDLIKETFDVAIRIGKFHDSELKARKFNEDKLVVVGSPIYLNSRKKPTSPDQINEWDFISFAPVPNVMLFHKQGKRVEKIWGATAAVTDSVHATHQLVLGGLGIATLPLSLVATDIKGGRLKTILPTWTRPPLDFYVVWHRNVGQTSLTRSFIDHMLETD